MGTIIETKPAGCAEDGVELDVLTEIDVGDEIFNEELFGASERQEGTASAAE